VPVFFARRYAHVTLLIALLACHNSTGTSAQPYVVVLPLVDSLFVGDSLPSLTATYYGADGNTLPTTSVRWSSASPGIVTIDPVLGTIHGVSTGIAIISATTNGAVGSALIVVSPTLSLTLLLDTIMLLPQDTFVVPALVRLQSGVGPPIWFSAASNAVFHIDSATGRVTALSPGQALPFTAHADSVTAGGTVEVLSMGDTTGGKGAFTVFGSVIEHRRATARAENYTRTGDTLTLRLAIKVPVGTGTVESVNLFVRTAVTVPDSVSLDSLSVSEAQGSSFICHPLRSAAVWASNATTATLIAVSRPGGWLVIRKVVPVTGGSAISGSFYFVAQRADYYGDPSGRLTIRGDFVAPLIQNTSTCH
jgi:hypothetical protein